MNRLLSLICLVMVTCPVQASTTDSVRALKEKGFSQEWIDGLTSQGQREVYAGDDLRYIGMPIGGLFCGQVYLGGDGQLWYWEINNVQSMKPFSPGFKYYLEPMNPTDYQNIEQGFAIRVTSQGKTQTRSLNRKGFSEIAFRGEYPVGMVKYRDAELPVEIDLTAYSPFCPTDSEQSGIPAVIMEYKVKNTSSQPVDVQLAGWLQNTINGFRGESLMGFHRNRIQSNSARYDLICDSVQKQAEKSETLENLPDYGSMVLSVLNPTAKAIGNAQIDEPLTETWLQSNPEHIQVPLKVKLIGGVSDTVQLQPGQSKTIVFAIAWHFPNIHKGYGGVQALTNIQNQRHYYAGRFADASEVAAYVSNNYKQLSETTKLWQKTWYDSTLPYWFLDRTFINVSTLATTVWHRFYDPAKPKLNGRPYCWEGVHLGQGTCTHVLHYEQAMGRVFPDVTRDLRSMVDYGLSFRESDGVIRYRAEYSHQGKHAGSEHAIDGHCGTIMRVYREHLMSEDDSFLRSIWPKIKKSIEVTIAQDSAKTGQPDGILEGPQYNTLDLTWYGKIPWISGLYCAALRAGAEMADDMGDSDFAVQCHRIANMGRKNMGEELFDGEYFIQELDNNHLDAPNTNVGSHIDQLLGQYWTEQVGLLDVFESDKTRAALRSIFRYNFFKDVDDYLKDPPVEPKRTYSEPGEAGCMMCVFPKGGGKTAHGNITGGWHATPLGYFSECWTGQEYTTAAVMIDSGLLLEGLTLVKAVHERYRPSRRNPYSEIEYGNHYTRAMSGYAPFISVSGFKYHGPKDRLGFEPKLSPENFKSAFITAEGWGSFTQQQTKNTQQVEIKLEWGHLQLQQLALELPENKTAESVKVTVNGREVKTKFTQKESHLVIDFKKKCSLKSGQSLIVKVNE